MERNILKKIRNSGFSLTKLAEEYPMLAALKKVPQEPEYHAEGNVYCHTEMVCRELVRLSGWQDLGEEEQELLFLAAAFHDIGKAVCTKQEEGKWVSPKHTILGEKEFRGMVYRETPRFGLTFRQREIVAKLIRYHGLPVWFWKKKRPEFDLFKAAESIPLRLLYLLSLADARGRISDSAEMLMEHVELFADYARETGVWEGSYAFTDSYTRFRYFHTENLWQGAKLYDDTEFDVIIMSGLPLSGKDSWIAKNRAEIPVVSLDNIREEMKIPPTKDSGKVVQTALKQAKGFLRKKEPFLWNATNIMEETRQKLVQLFAGYGARVHLIYLEVPYEELLARNRQRERYIPKTALENMIRKLELPVSWEAHEVKWLTS